MNASWHQLAGPQQYATTHMPEVHGVRGDGPAAEALGGESVTKKRKLSVEREGRRRLSKTTRACDACKYRKARCSGTKPCESCAKRGVECLYDSQYMRGRPPTPPLSTPEAVAVPQYKLTSPHVDGNDHQLPPSRNERHARLVDYEQHHLLSAMTDGQETRGPSRSRSSPELDATDIGGQYVDTTSGLSFLARARKRLIGFRGLDTESQNPALQPLATAGDKPMITSTESPILPDNCEARELLDLYFDVCIATYKPLHRPTVDRWYAMAQSQNGAGNVSQVLGHAKASVLLCIFAVANFHRQKARGATDDVTALTISDAYF
nr:hypothetical protein B0A51_02629 [Rachicladosporium sp. CCFEE 5018]